MSFNYDQYIRPGKLPHIWCPGCSHGITLKSIIRAIDSLKLKKDDISMVSGIGCSSRAPGYVDFNTLHTTHGRALAFATGVKFANPKLNVIVISGDGDATAIGGNHFIHACRRNIDMTLVVMNNNIYGMTGGQFSPTTPQGAFATTTPYGNPDPAFDICSVAEAAGASFVARGTTYHVPALDKLISQAIAHKGFSVVEVVSACPVYYGRKNKIKSAADMLRIQKDSAVSVAAAAKMKPEELEGKFKIGVLAQKQRAEYCEEYEKVRAKAAGKGR